MARFHLASQRSHVPNVARTAWERPGTTLLTLIQPGMLLEYRANQHSLQYTSDARMLQSQSPSCSISYARSAVIGPNLLAVSWGSSHATSSRVVLYRRLTKGHADNYHWHAVAVCDPSPAVMDHVQTEQQAMVDEASNHCDLLRVTDIVPIVVEQNGSDHRIPAVTLAIARLGGYLELWALPHALWYGPELNINKQQQRQPPHRLPGPAVLLTTLDYHTDIISLQVMRTRVQEDSMWNPERYPDGPPSEHVLAATGTNGNHQVVSFWSVSTVYGEEQEPSADSPRRRNRPDNNKSIGFSLVARLTEALDLGSAGPDVSIFGTREIYKYWRRPRNVQLKETNSDAALATEGEQRVTTISIPAPICSMRFLPHGDDFFRLALLDWNGGVAVLDCDLLERAASQTLTDEEYKIVHAKDTLTPLVIQLNDRMSTLHQLSTGAYTTAAEADIDVTAITCRILSLEWPNRVLCGPDEASILAVVTSKPNLLCLVSPFGETDPITVPLSNQSITRLHQFESGHLSLVSTRQRPHSRELSIAALHRMDATEIVKVLALEKHQYAAAIAAAAALPDPQTVAPIVQDCQRHLWEYERERSALESMADDRYIIEQALQNCHAGADEFRFVHTLALTRLSKATGRVGAMIALGGLGSETDSTGTDRLIQRVRSRWIKLGTFELLCRHFGTDQSWDLFQREILPISAADLARSFARAADMVALSLLYFRHGTECEWLDVADEIPLVLPVANYRHLLPHVKGDGFFLDDNNAVLESSTHLPTFLADTYGIDCTLDAEDEKIVLGHRTCSSFSTEDSQRICALENWYFARAVRIQIFLSSISGVLEFTDTALVALGLKENGISSSPTAGKLRAFNVRYRLLWEFVQEEVEDVDTSQLAQVERLDGLDMVDLVAVVMKGREGSSEIHRRFIRFLLPLAQQMLKGDQACLDTEVAKAMASYCRRVVEESSDATRMRKSVSFCSAFLSLSRSDLHKENRIIKEKETMTSLVLSVFESVIETCARIELELQDRRLIVNNLWSLYECTPIAVVDKSGFGTSYRSLSLQLDEVYRNLVLLDVLYRWEGSDAFVMILKRIKCDDECLPAVDEEVAVSLCQSFCQQVGWVRHDRPLEGEDLLSDMLQDFDDLNRLVFHDSFPIKDTLSRDLLAPLLQQRQIHLLGSSIAMMKPEWIDLSSVSGDVSNFVQNAVFASPDDNSSANLYAAIRCQEVLGKYLPDLTSLFTDVRRCFDSADFINSVLFSDKDEEFITPASLRRQPSLDVIDFLLSKDPMLVVHDSRDWSGFAWACATNQSIRSYFRKKANLFPDGPQTTPPPPPPPPPGRALLHLSTLMGMTESESLEVRHKLAHVCIYQGFHGAAAAICRTFFVDLSPFPESPALLRLLAALVTATDYQDMDTKRELCTLVFQNYKGNLSTSSSKAYGQILATYTGAGSASLERARPPRNPLPSFQRLCLDTMEEYSVDLAELFSTLVRQAASSAVDDELLNALARYAVYWCVAQCTRPKLGGPIPFDDLCIPSNMSLASSLILHILTGDLRRECCSQTKSIFENEHTAALNLKLPELATNFSKPNEEVVDRLMHRGYTQFGARRSAMMCPSGEYDEALQWAIMHCLDLGFDDPVLYIRKENQVDVNKAGIRCMENAMGELMSIVVDGTVSLKFSKTKPALPVSQSSWSFTDNLAKRSTGRIAKEGQKLQRTSETADQNGHGESSTRHNVQDGSKNLPPMGLIQSPSYNKTSLLEKLSWSEDSKMSTALPPIVSSASTNGRTVQTLDRAKLPITLNGSEAHERTALSEARNAPMETSQPNGIGNPGSGRQGENPGLGRLSTKSPTVAKTVSPAPPPKRLDVHTHRIVDSTRKQTTPRHPPMSPKLGSQSRTPLTSTSSSTAARVTPRIPPSHGLLSPNTRNRMKEEGSAILRRMRGSTPAKLNDRNRLIEEGRRLLLKARESPLKSSQGKRPGPPPRPPPGPPPGPKPLPPPSKAAGGDDWDFDDEDLR